MRILSTEKREYFAIYDGFIMTQTSTEYLQFMPTSLSNMLIRQTLATQHANDLHEKMNEFTTLILQETAVQNLQHYSLKVNEWVSNLPSSPVNFQNLAEYQHHFLRYIPVLAHLQIQQAWQNHPTQEHLYIQDFAFSSSTHLDNHLCEYVMSFNLSQNTHTPFRRHLHMGVFLLEYQHEQHASFLAIAQPTRSSKSTVLHLRFRFLKEEKTNLDAALANKNSRWSLKYITSLIDIARDYASLHQLNETHHCAMSTIQTRQTSYITDHLQYDLRNYELNATQDRIVQQLLQRSNNVNILYGPPGTGKTKTLTAFICQALQFHRRILITAPSNQALGVLAERVMQHNPIRLCILGSHHALPEALSSHFFSGWYLRLLNQFQTIQDLFNAFIDHVNTQEAHTTSPSTLINHLINAFEQFITQIYLSDALLEQLRHHQIDLASEKLKLEALNNDQTSCRILFETFKTLFYRLNQFVLKDNFLYAQSIEQQLLTQHETAYFATPSTIGRMHLENMDIVIIEEAGQLEERHTLPILKVPMHHLIIAGDPQQLSPISLSSELTLRNLNRSLLYRLIHANFPYFFLNEQYRMHPMICTWASDIIYGKQLITSDAYQEKSYPIPGFIGGPIAFFNFHKTQSVRYGSSFYHADECSSIVQLVRQLRSFNPHLKIGIIAFYAAQRERIANVLYDLDHVIIATVDGFQGGECDCIILATTRTDQLGFIADPARINVALTRAKDLLIVMGCAAVLQHSSVFQTFIEYTKTHTCYYEQETLEQLLQSNTTTYHPSAQTMEQLNEQTELEKALAQTLAKEWIKLSNKIHERSQNIRALTQEGYAIDETSLETLTHQLQTLREAEEILKKTSVKPREEKTNLKKLSLFQREQLKYEQELQEKKEIEARLIDDRTRLFQASCKHTHWITNQTRINFEYQYRQLQETYQKIHDRLYTQHLPHLQNEIQTTLPINTQSMIPIANRELRSLYFYQLSLIAYQQDRPWDALFFALHLERANLTTQPPRQIHTSCILDQNYTHGQMIIQACLISIVKDDPALLPMKTRSMELKTLLNSIEFTPTKKIVIARLMLDSASYATKLIAINHLISLYIRYAYDYGIEEMFLTLRQCKDDIKRHLEIIPEESVSLFNSHIQQASSNISIAIHQILSNINAQHHHDVLEHHLRIALIKQTLAYSEYIQDEDAMTHDLNTHIIALYEKINADLENTSSFSDHDLNPIHYRLMIAHDLMTRYIENDQATSLTNLFQSIQSIRIDTVEDPLSSFFQACFLYRYFLYLSKNGDVVSAMTSLKDHNINTMQLFELNELIKTIMPQKNNEEEDDESQRISIGYTRK